MEFYPGREAANLSGTGFWRKCSSPLPSDMDPAQPWNSVWSGPVDDVTGLLRDSCSQQQDTPEMPAVIGNFIFKCFPQHSCMARSASAVGLFRWLTWAGPLGCQGEPSAMEQGSRGVERFGHSPEAWSFMSAGCHLQSLSELMDCMARQ